MFVLGLTGSIGMGKSATADMFRALGVPVHDADAAVHALYRGEAVPPVEQEFPGVTRNGEIDRAELGKRVLGNPDALRRLEKIVHPLVRAQEEIFRASAHARNAQLIVIDVPLLFEKNQSHRCDGVCVVSAPPDVQRARVLARPGMSAEKFEAILRQQMPDADKRQRAHFIIDTSLGFESARRSVQDIVRALAGRSGSNRQE
ncbi:MAG: dephospho-CoA kinase [Beijerinckiaceae bacterium]